MLVGADPSDAPINGLSAEWLDRFADGDALFEAPYLANQGLGPAYIRPSNLELSNPIPVAHRVLSG